MPESWGTFDPSRFLEDFRETQALDAEPEFTELCSHDCGRPAAYLGECFTCATERRLPS
jgi:hypothetical protein